MEQDTAKPSKRQGSALASGLFGERMYLYRQGVLRQLAQQLAERWGRQVIHVWGRDFTGAPWLMHACLACVLYRALEEGQPLG